MWNFRVVLVGLSLLLTLPASRAVVRDIPSLYFDFEELAGPQVPNRAPGVPAGTRQGSIFLTPEGVFGQAARFEPGGYISLNSARWPEDRRPDRSLTLTTWLWVDPRGPTGPQTLLAGRGTVEGRTMGMRIAVSRDSKRQKVAVLGHLLHLIAPEGTGRSWWRAGTVPLGEWVHLGIVFTLSGVTVYRNGALDDFAYSGHPFFIEHGIGLNGIWSGKVRIGLDIPEGSPFQGRLDELALWPRGLTEEEIADLYRRGRPALDVSPGGALPVRWAALKAAR